jgi:hypothetical protein
VRPHAASKRPESAGHTCRYFSCRAARLVAVSHLTTVYAMRQRAQAPPAVTPPHAPSQTHSVTSEETYGSASALATAGSPAQAVPHMPANIQATQLSRMLPPITDCLAPSPLRQQVRAHLGHTDMVDASHHVLSSERQGIEHCHRVAVHSGRCPKWQQCTRNVRVPAGLNNAAQQHYRERNEPQPLTLGRLCSAFITM